MKPERKIIRTNRKTIAIVIENDGRLIVRAPRHTSVCVIDRLIQKNLDWIHAKQHEARKRSADIEEKYFQEGEMFFFLGDLYPLVFVDRLKPALSLSDRFELSFYPKHAAKQTFTNWYRQKARDILTERVEIFAKEYGFNYDRIWITGAQTRWGSCNSKGGLNFSWRLVMAPLHVIDYVVVHELVHTKINNHSKVFWQRLGYIMPDFRKRAEWLKINGYKLNL